MVIEASNGKCKDADSIRSIKAGRVEAHHKTEGGGSDRRRGSWLIAGLKFGGIQRIVRGRRRVSSSGCKKSRPDPSRGEHGPHHPPTAAANLLSVVIGITA